MNGVDEKTIRAALNVYACLKRGQKKYRETHSEKHCEYSRAGYHRLKADPERYAVYLEQRRIYQKERRQKKALESANPPSPDLGVLEPLS